MFGLTARTIWKIFVSDIVTSEYTEHPNETSPYSYETVVKRWPIILTKIIDQIHRENHEVTMRSVNAGEGTELKSWEPQVDEGKGIIGKVSRLKYEMARDKELQHVFSLNSAALFSNSMNRIYRPIQDDGEADVDIYNQELERLAESAKNTWFSCPWLYAECVK